MPAVDTTYIIGVIREWEKGFLEEDEYTRLIESPDGNRAVHTLADTPYGKWLDMSTKEPGMQQALAALSGHIKYVHEWLGDKLADERVWQFISARYDALNVATALVSKANNEEKPSQLSNLGVITQDVLESSLWHNLGWDAMPEFWEKTMREIISDKMEPMAIMAQVAKSELAWKKTLAFTPLMTAVVNWQASKTKEANEARPMQDEVTAVNFEKKWDERLLSICRQFNKEPIGYDPIIAFWYGKEIEVKTLRVLLTAKFAGTATQEIREMNRSLYRSLS